MVVIRYITPTFDQIIAGSTLCYRLGKAGGSGCSADLPCANRAVGASAVIFTGACAESKKLTGWTFCSDGFGCAFRGRCQVLRRRPKGTGWAGNTKIVVRFGA